MNHSSLWPTVIGFGSTSMIVLPIVFLVAAIFSSPAKTEDGISPRPNIIFVVADDLVRTLLGEFYCLFLYFVITVVKERNETVINKKCITLYV